MRRAVARRRWGIEMRSAIEGWGGPLGWGWMDPRLPDPAYADDWPASFKTRLEARTMARHLTAKYAYLGPCHRWRFRPVALVIAVWTQRSA